MNIALTISCFLIFGFIHEGNGCCCTINCFLIGYNCNIFGCNCAFEKCTQGVYPIPGNCDPDEKCSDKKFRYRIEVIKFSMTE